MTESCHRAHNKVLAKAPLPNRKYNSAKESSHEDIGVSKMCSTLLFELCSITYLLNRGCTTKHPFHPPGSLSPIEHRLFRALYIECNNLKHTLHHPNLLNASSHKYVPSAVDAMTEILVVRSRLYSASNRRLWSRSRISCGG